jgi:hypothetical protein
MQLTRFDRWLRERFVYETHVFTMRPPGQIPAGLIAREVPEAPGRTYRHRFIARDPKLAEQFIAILKDNNQMFTTRVVDRSAWYVPIIAPKNRSLTYWLAWAAISAAAIYVITAGLHTLWSNPEFRANALDALKVFKG